MKATKHIILIQSIILISCVQPDDYEIPNQQIVEVTIDPSKIITISALRNLLLQEIANSGNEILSFDEENPNNDRYVSGYVISNDEAGNFFKELIIQNDSINPRAGVKVLIDLNPLHSTFEYGRKVYIKLSGLSVGYNNGVLSLGIRNRNSVDNIAESQLFEFITRDPKVANIYPLATLMNKLNDEYTNLYIKLTDVQFHRYDVMGERPKTFAGEPLDEYDGERLLESCVDRSQIVLSTSTFADFKALELPVEKGSLDGILLYNFYGDKRILKINDPRAIYFDDNVRCDPLELSCGIAGEQGMSIILSEFFEDQIPGTPINSSGWTNYSEEGSIMWEAYFEEGPNASLGISANVGSYNSGDTRSISWLITPQVNFDLNEAETLRFKTSNSFSDGSTLELLFSNDWDGTIETIRKATWSILKDAYIVHDDDDFGEWWSSGIVDLSCISGSGNIAWKYIGSGELSSDGTFELDEIEIHSD